MDYPLLPFPRASVPFRSVPFRGVCSPLLGPSRGPFLVLRGEGGGEGAGCGGDSLSPHPQPPSRPLSLRSLPPCCPPPFTPSRSRSWSRGYAMRASFSLFLSLSLCQFSSPENEEGRDNGGGGGGIRTNIIYYIPVAGYGLCLGRTESWGKFMYGGGGRCFAAAGLCRPPPPPACTDSPLEGT